MGFGAEYRREVRSRLHAAARPEPLAESAVSSLPAPLQRYLRVAGAMGQPRVHHFRAAWRGRIRGAARDPWMPFTAEQYDFPGEPSRFFHMRARRAGLPVSVLHVFAEGAASMRVRLLSLFPITDAKGPELTRAETVTLFNDLCLLAPGALVGPAFTFEPIDAGSVHGTYTLGAHTVHATLHLNDRGELVDFVSEDRLMASPDGRTFTPCRWSTPVRDYRRYGDARASSRGAGLWHLPEGAFTYIELELLDLQINGGWVE